MIVPAPVREDHDRNLLRRVTLCLPFTLGRAGTVFETLQPASTHARARHSAHSTRTRRKPRTIEQRVPENFSTSATSLPAGRRRASALKCSDTSNFAISATRLKPALAIVTRAEVAQKPALMPAPERERLQRAHARASPEACRAIRTHSRTLESWADNAARRKRIWHAAAVERRPASLRRRNALKRAPVELALPFALVRLALSIPSSPWLLSRPSARPAASVAAASRCPRCGHREGVQALRVIAARVGAARWRELRW